MTGFYLRVNEQWVPLDGVQAGVDIQSGRASTEVMSVGGVRDVQYAPYAARVWNLDFGHASPEAVNAVRLAAAGQSGEVWLWDEQAARQNMLPVEVLGRPDYPIVDCGGLNLRSLTQGPGGVIEERVDVKPVAQMSLRGPLHADPDRVLRRLWVNPLVDGFLKFQVPPTPEGKTLVGGHLRLIMKSQTTGRIGVWTASNAWVEPSVEIGTDPGYWATVRGDTQLTTGMMSDEAVSWLSLSAVIASFAGSTVSFNLRSDTPALSGQIMDRFEPVTPPVLRLIYQVAQKSTQFTLRARPLSSATLSFWTNAPPSRAVLELQDVSTGVWHQFLTPASGSGWRRVQIELGVAGGEIPVRVFDSSDYLLAGPQMTTIPTSQYYPPATAAAKVAVDDPTLNLDRLYPGQQGEGQRTVTIREVGR